MDRLTYQTEIPYFKKCSRKVIRVIVSKFSNVACSYAWRMKWGSMNSSSQSTGGAKANKQGNALESLVETQLKNRGYNLMHPNEFLEAKANSQTIYSKQFKIAKSIYKTQLKCDFLIHHPKKWPNNLAIECKWQQVSGSVDEKFPYLVLNLGLQFPCESIILADGEGARPAATEWLKSQEKEYPKLLYVFSMVEFQKWSNTEL